jgi:hypothetical protein
VKSFVDTIYPWSDLNKWVYLRNNLIYLEFR